MTRHFLQVEDARVLQTTSYLKAKRVLQDCAAARAIGVVHGIAGLGKTFAVESAAADADIPATWFAFARRPSYTSLLKGMLKELTGIDPTGELYKLGDELRDVLAEKPRIIVIDEAQQLNADVFEFLRFFHDDPATDFALVFVGGNGCWKVISRYPMLRSRVYREIRMRPLDESEVLDLIPRYHPVHADALPETLLMINEEFAHGSLRLWASFTKTVAELCAGRDCNTYDEPLALASLGLLPDWASR